MTGNMKFLTVEVCSIYCDISNKNLCFVFFSYGFQWPAYKTPLAELMPGLPGQSVSCE
jgi:hypothetical protein